MTIGKQYGVSASFVAPRSRSQQHPPYPITWGPLETLNPFVVALRQTQD